MLDQTGRTDTDTDTGTGSDADEYAGPTSTASSEPSLSDVPTMPTGALASTGGAALWLPLLGALLLIAGAGHHGGDPPTEAKA